MHLQPEGPVVVKVKAGEVARPSPGAGPAPCVQRASPLPRPPSSPTCSAALGPWRRPAAQVTSAASCPSSQCQPLAAHVTWAPALPSDGSCLSPGDRPVPPWSLKPWPSVPIPSCWPLPLLCPPPGTPSPGLAGCRLSLARQAQRPPSFSAGPFLTAGISPQPPSLSGSLCFLPHLTSRVLIILLVLFIACPPNWFASSRSGPLLGAQAYHQDLV